MYVKLAPPPDEADLHDGQVANVKQMFRARKSRISRAKRRTIDKNIRKWYEEWERNTSSLRAKSAELNEFLEGKDEAVDFPFGPESSSSIDVRLAAGYARTARAQFNKAIFSDPTRTYIMLKTPGVERQDLNRVELGVNYTAEYESNLNEVLKDSYIPIYRDGTYLIHGRWERRIEHGHDFRSYYTPQEFQADYPSFEDAGISEDDYEEILLHLHSDGAEVHTEYELDFVAKNGAHYTGFPLAKFIFWPMHEQHMDRLNLYGYTMSESSSQFDMKAKMGYYDADVVEVVKKKSPEYRKMQIDSWDARREAIEGIGQTDSQAITYRLAWFVYTADLDNDGIVERYVIIYDLDKYRSLRIEPYTVRRNIPCVVPLRLIRREGRFLGVSLLGDSEHLFREINALHRHRSNQRRITDSVTLILPEGLREHVDLGAEYASFRPGTPMWVPDQYMHPNMSPRQLQIQDTSQTRGSVDEEGLIQRYLDMLLGTSQGQSGRESAQDPSAPASKTAMLLQRADLRTEDFADEWARTIPELIDLHRAIYFQNAGKEVKVMAKSGEEMIERNIPTRLFSDPRIRGALKPIKQSLAPEIEMQKMAALAAAAMRFVIPMQSKPEILIHLWNDYVSAARIERPERYQIQIGEGGQYQMGGQNINPEQMNTVIQQLIQQSQAPAMGRPTGGGGGEKARANAGSMRMGG